MPERGRHSERGTPGAPAGGSTSVGAGLVLEHGTLGARVARLAVADAFDATHPATGGARRVYVLRAAAAKNQPLVHRVVCEADAAGWLRNPAAAKLLGHGHTPGGRLYVAVERPAGRTLRDILAASGPLPTPRVVRMACHLVEALAEAHAVGLVHGHLTPAAVLLAPDPDAPGGARVSLTGLGLTWLAVARDVHAADRPYLCPERLAGREPDVRSDVYGLAAVLRDALGAEAASGDVGAVLDAALAAEPRRRHPGVKELWEDVLAALVTGVRPRPAPLPAPSVAARAAPSAGASALDLDAIALELEIIPIPPPPRAMSADVAAVAASGWIAVPAAGPAPWIAVDPWAPATPPGATPPGETPIGWSRSASRDAGAGAGEGATRAARRPSRAHTLAPAPLPPRPRRGVARLVLWLAVPAAAAALAWSRAAEWRAPPPAHADAGALQTSPD